MQHVLKCNTPDAARDLIVTMLRQIAGGYRLDAALSERKTARMIKDKQADALAAAAELISRLDVVPL